MTGHPPRYAERVRYHAVARTISHFIWGVGCGLTGFALAYAAGVSVTAVDAIYAVSFALALDSLARAYDRGVRDGKRIIMEQEGRK